MKMLLSCFFLIQLLFATASAACTPLTSVPPNSCDVTCGQINVLPSTFSRVTTASELSTTNYPIPSNCVFMIYSPLFLPIIGNNPALNLIAQKDYQFAHEAAVYLPETDEVVFTSNRLGNTSSSNQSVEVWKISLKNNNQLTLLNFNPPVVMGNGGTYVKNNTILLLSQGHLSGVKSGIVEVDLQTMTSKYILNNFHGLRFNSLNDIVIDKHGCYWFTDPQYGYDQLFAPTPQGGAFVYVWIPQTSELKVVADGFVRPNGVAISNDQSVLYVTDSGFYFGDGSWDPARPHTIYAYDIVRDSTSARLENRRVFAVCDGGIPDGVKVDSNDYLYVGVNDGVNVYTPFGKLIGKIAVNGVANLALTKDKIIILNEKQIYSVAYTPSASSALSLAISSSSFLLLIIWLIFA